MHARCLLWLWLGACGADVSDETSAGDDLSDPQLPARGTDDVVAWLDAGYYRSWHCEAERHPGRAPSPHGGARICDNDALHDAIAGGGPFPAGAASVKELFDGDALVGFAVARKLSDGTGGDRWYWYEAKGEKVYANSAGAGNCTGCHDAARDYIFTLL